MGTKSKKEEIHVYILLPQWLRSKELACNAGGMAGDTTETCLLSLACEYLLEKKMAAHCSVLAWKIPWTEESQGLRSMGLQKSEKQLRN